MKYNCNYLPQSWRNYSIRIWYISTNSFIKFNTTKDKIHLMLLLLHRTTLTPHDPACLLCSFLSPIISQLIEGVAENSRHKATGR